MDSKAINRKLFVTYKLWLEFIIGCVIGGIAFVAIYGFKILDFTYDSWLLPNNIMFKDNDLSQHYLGWVAYRNSPWDFPLGLTNNLTYPGKLSVIFTDSIPAYAIVFKLLSPILPKTFQYMGLYGLISFMLQGGFASIILCKFSDSRIFNMSFAAFFVMSYPAFLRMYLHTALGAHWIILAAIAIWIYDKELSCKLKVLFWGLLSGLCVITEMYFLPIVFGIMCGSLLYRLIVYKDVKGLILSFMSAGLGVGITGYIFGLFYGDVKAGSTGYGEIKANFNTFFNPMLDSSKILKELSGNEMEIDGFCFLGIGILILIVANVIKQLISRTFYKTTTPESKAALISIAAITVVFVIFATSNNASFNNIQLYSIKLPDKVFEICSIFRSAGRMMWPVYYGALLGTAYLTYRNFNKKEVVMCAMVVACFCLQVYDSSEFYTYRGDYCKAQHIEQTELSDPAWDFIASNYEHINFFPRSIKLFSNNLTYCFEDYCLSNGLTMNTTYLSREMKGLDRSIGDEFEGYYQGEPLDPDTVWVFFDYIPTERIDGMYRYLINNILIGLPNYHEELSDYYLNQDEVMGMYSTYWVNPMNGDFSGATGIYTYDEIETVWSRSRLHVYVINPYPGTDKFYIGIETHRAFCEAYNPDNDPVIHININGINVQDFEMVDGCSTIEIDISEFATSHLEIELQADAEYSLEAIGEGEDDRVVSFGISYMGPL